MPSTLAPNLPERAYVGNPWCDEARTQRLYGSDNAPVIEIRRGEPGYTPCFDGQSADVLNAAAGVTPAQREAMLVGSMFGWHAPAADPGYQAALLAANEMRTAG